MPVTTTIVYVNRNNTESSFYVSSIVCALAAGIRRGRMWATFESPKVCTIREPTGSDRQCYLDEMMALY